jgi:hypothetical protein
METTKAIYILGTKTVTVFLNFKEAKNRFLQAYVAWRAGTTTIFLFGSLSPRIVLKFQLCRWFRFAQLAKGKKFRP